MKKPLIVFLTGAGISQPSGIPTFRGEEGLWNNYEISEVATMSAFMRQPDIVTAFFNDLNKTLSDKKPNHAHNVIAGLEKDYDVIVYTQNVDTLHEKAGSTNVKHLHGKHDEMKCLNCKQIWENKTLKNWVYDRDQCPNCGSTKVKQNIILFGEALDGELMLEAERNIYFADVFIQIGTSALVSPVCNLVKRALPRRKRVEMNLTRSSPKNPHLFQHYYMGNIINTIDQLALDLPKMLPNSPRKLYPIFGDKKDKERYTCPPIVFYSK